MFRSNPLLTVDGNLGAGFFTTDVDADGRLNAVQHLAGVHTGERVKLEAESFSRIDEHRLLATAHIDATIHIKREPCPGGAAFDRWYLCTE